MKQIKSENNGVVMYPKFHPKSYSVLSLVATLLLSLTIVPQALAHGGEDHGDQQPATAQMSANMTVRVARVEDYEVTLKHPNLEPDKELTARIFITRYETNEPVKAAKVVITIEGGNLQTQEITATATDTVGLYELKFPPMAQGDYKLGAHIVVSNSSLAANFGTVQVAVASVETSAESASWARTIFIVLGVFLLLALLGILLIVAIQYGRREKRVKEETVTA